MQITPLLGTTAGLLTVVSYLPQAVRAWRTQKTKDLSYGTLVLLILSALAWIAYGVAISQWPVTATNIGVFGLTVAILLAKRRHG